MKTLKNWLLKYEYSKVEVLVFVFSILLLATEINFWIILISAGVVFYFVSEKANIYNNK